MIGSRQAAWKTAYYRLERSISSQLEYTMPEITIFDFQNNAVRSVLINYEPWFFASDICRCLELNNVTKAISRLESEEVDNITSSDTTGREHNYTVINESGLYSLVLGSRKLVAKPFKSWVTKEVLPTIRRTGSYNLNTKKAELEQQFAEPAEVKLLKDIGALYRDAFGESYYQRWLQQQVAKHYPMLAGDAPVSTELASLPTAKAFLTCTEIANQLNQRYSTGNPNPQPINKKLVELGYQEIFLDHKGRKKYNPTMLALELKLCDRKPVSTNSKTQQDQLLWSMDVVGILKEHFLTV